MLRQITLSIALFVSSLATYAQDDPVLVVSGGHHQGIISIDISPDDKYIVSGAEDHLVKVYDIKRRQELNTFSNHSKDVTKVLFSKDGKHIISASSREVLIHSHPEGKFVTKIEVSMPTLLYDLAVSEKNELFIPDGMHGMEVYDIATGKRIRQLENVESYMFSLIENETKIFAPALGDNSDRGYKYFDIVTGEELDYFHLEDVDIKIDNHAISPNGRYVAHEFNRNQIAIIDLKTKSLVRTIKSGLGVQTLMKILPDNKTLVLSSYDHKVRFWNIKTGEEEKVIDDLSPNDSPMSMSMMINSADYTSDGKTIAFAYSDLTDGRQFYTVEWFDIKTMKSLGKYAGDVKISLSISIDPSGSILSTGVISKVSGVKSFDLKKGSQKGFIQGGAFFGSGGNYIAALEQSDWDDPRLEIYEMPSHKLFKSFDLFGWASIQMSESGRLVSAIDQKYDGGEGALAKVAPHVRIWDVESGEEVVQIRKSLMDNPFDIQFSPDDKTAILLYPSKIELIDIGKGEIVKSIPVSLHLFNTNNPFTPDGRIVIPNLNNAIEAVNYKTGEQTKVFSIGPGKIPVTTSFSPDKKLFAVSCITHGINQPHKILVYSWETKELICELNGHVNFVRQVIFDHQNEHVYSIDDNGMITMWDLKECKAKASFLAMGKEDFMIVTPQGYYKASRGGIPNVGFRQKGMLYSYDQFDIKYNRPDIVLEELGLASDRQLDIYRNAYQKRMSRLGFPGGNLPSVINAPEISIKNQAELPLSTKDHTLSLDLFLEEKVSSLDRVVVHVNGVIQKNDKFDLKKEGLKQKSMTIPVELSYGENLISVHCVNSTGIGSVKQQVAIDCKKPASNRNLYVLTFGASHFKDSTMNLSYADKDALDLQSILNEQSHYDNIHSLNFGNENVTKERISEAREFLSKATVDDEVILFYSGHGLLGNDLTYYLSSYGVDFNDPEGEGIPFDAFTSLVTETNARKRLILIDACHSGELGDETQDKEPANIKSKSFARIGKKNSFEVMKDLFVDFRKESGATIIASSSGKSLSYESDRWQNGVFTYALKEALLELKADSDKDNKVSVTELKSYLFTRVSQLTNGQQKPTVREENIMNNWVIYK